MIKLTGFEVGPVSGGDAVVLELLPSVRQQHPGRLSQRLAVEVEKLYLRHVSRTIKNMINYRTTSMVARSL